MVERPRERDERRLRVDQAVAYARDIAKQVWDEDRRLADQAQALSLDHISWLTRKFPGAVSKPFGDHHLEYWEHIESIKAGVKPKAYFMPWARGGAKSKSMELGVVRLGHKGVRKFCLYVCGTQIQANLHVQAIAKHFEDLGVEKAVNKYGRDRGWSASKLITSIGFSVIGIGLDTAARGFRVDDDRPDIIVFDDIDAESDSPSVVEGKEEAIKSALLPAGSTETAVFFCQNLIHDGGVLNRLITGRSKYLLDRVPPKIVPAATGLKVDTYTDEDGSTKYKVLDATPTWAGQDKETIEAQINEIGLETFLREAQHEVEGVSGLFFEHTKVKYVDALPKLPAGQKWKFIRAWDFAATLGAGDYTVGVLIALHPNRRSIYILDVIRHQYDPGRAEQLLLRTTQRDKKGEVWSNDRVDKRGNVLAAGEKLFNFDGCTNVRLPEDPAAAAKYQVAAFKKLLEPVGVTLTIKPVVGKKAVREKGLAETTNRGDTYFVKGDWNHAASEEMRLFREDEKHEHDDICDAMADGHNELVPKAEKKTAQSRQG
jgi:phage terminase large subunit-like protein